MGSFREGTAGPVAKQSLTTSSSPRIPPNNCFTSASSHLVQMMFFNATLNGYQAFGYATLLDTQASITGTPID